MSRAARAGCRAGRAYGAPSEGSRAANPWHGICVDIPETARVVGARKGSRRGEIRPANATPSIEEL